jgi:predicted Zn-dependent protease
VAESLNQVYVVAPPQFSLLQETEPIALDRLGHALRSWIA